MPTQEQWNQQKEAVLGLIDKLLEIEPNKLARNELGIELNFTQGTKSFEKINRLLKEFKLINIDELEFSHLTTMTTQLKAIQAHYKAIQEFSIAKHPTNAAQQRDGILTTLSNHAITLFNYITPFILYYRKVSDYENNAGTIIEKLKEKADDALSKIGNYENQIKETLGNIRNAAAEVGVAQHSIHFSKTAEEHNKYANIWLGCTLILVSVTLGIAGIFANNLYNIIQQVSSIEAKESVVSTVYLVQYGIAKLLLLSILYFAVLWANKNYKAHRHCNVVNKHRQNALSTFEAFVKSTDDSQTKNAVLIQASSCIFTPQHTGYLTFEPESGTNPTILEIVRGAVEKK